MKVNKQKRRCEQGDLISLLEIDKKVFGYSQKTGKTNQQIQVYHAGSRFAATLLDVIELIELMRPC